MIKRQQRLQQIAAVFEEYLAAKTAGTLLNEKLSTDPSYGRRTGWEPRAGRAFAKNLETTYVVRMYAEFEAGLRDYWRTHLRQTTYPAMLQLVRHAIPNQRFSQDCVDNADDVRRYRNFLVHELDDELPADMPSFAITEVKKHLCDYFGRLDPKWR